MKVTSQLAEKIVYSNPLNDNQAVDAAKIGLLDWLSSTLAAKEEPLADAIIALLDGTGGTSNASIIGRSYRTRALDAALINGFLGHALDYDDVHASVRGHPSTVILPALLALAEEQHATGADFLAAYVIGIETMCRIGLALGAVHYETGWHGTSTVGVLGAAAACARLMQLDISKTSHALGLAATQASGLRVHFGSDVKPLHAGLAAQAGLLSAKLASAGIEGMPDSLDGQLGFMNIYASGKAQPEKAIEAWGDPWQIVTPGLWFKTYPCCSAAHHAADAALTIREAYKPVPSDIADITITFPPQGDAALVIREPRTGVEGRFSVEYIVAAALTDGKLNIHTFTDTPIRPELQELAQRVIRKYDSSIEPAVHAMPAGRFSIVTITMEDGTIYSERVDAPRGSPNNPLTMEHHLAKYNSTIDGLANGWAALPDKIKRFETLTNLSQFIPNN